MKRRNFLITLLMPFFVSLIPGFLKKKKPDIEVEKIYVNGEEVWEKGKERIYGAVDLGFHNGDPVFLVCNQKEKYIQVRFVGDNPIMLKVDNV